MTIEYIRYTIPPDRAASFEASYARGAEALAASAHCRGYEIARCVEDPTSYVVRIDWDSVEGHLEGFRRSDEFRRFFQHVQPFVEEIQEMRHYEATSSSR